MKKCSRRQGNSEQVQPGDKPEMPVFDRGDNHKDKLGKKLKDEADKDSN